MKRIPGGPALPRAGFHIGPELQGSGFFIARQDSIMPWGPRDAQRHTRKANSPTAKRQWSHVANSMLQRGSSEGAAVRAANAAVAKRRGTRKRGGKRR